MAADHHKMPKMPSKNEIKSMASDLVKRVEVVRDERSNLLNEIRMWKERAIVAKGECDFANIDHEKNVTHIEQLKDDKKALLHHLVERAQMIDELDEEIVSRESKIKSLCNVEPPKFSNWYYRVEDSEDSNQTEIVPDTP